MIMNCVIGNWSLNSLESSKPFIPFVTWIKCGCWKWLFALGSDGSCGWEHMVGLDQPVLGGLGCPLRGRATLYRVASLRVPLGVPHSQIVGAATCISLSSTKLLSERLKFYPLLQLLEKQQCSHEICNPHFLASLYYPTLISFTRSCTF